jgi:hypothetical protein
MMREQSTVFGSCADFTAAWADAYQPHDHSHEDAASSPPTEKHEMFRSDGIRQCFQKY